MTYAGLQPNEETQFKFLSEFALMKRARGRETESERGGNGNW